MSDDDRSKETNASQDKPRIQIERILDSLAQGLASIRKEDYFHGFLPKKETHELLKNVGDFLVRQETNKNTKSSKDMIMLSVRIIDKSEEPVDPEAEIVHLRIKYSRRARIHYMHKFGFRLASGLISYHRRQKLPVDEKGTTIDTPIKKASWQLNHEQISKLGKLGGGAFGDVFKGYLHAGIIRRTDVAIKTINSKISDEENQKLFTEAMLMKEFKHPNIIHLLGVATNEDPLMVVIEYAEKGAVEDLVKNVEEPPSLYHRVYWCYGAAKGMEYLESQHIIHRDIASRNVLVGKDGEAKISDFGLSVAGEFKRQKKLGKVPYTSMSPEVINKGNYSHKSDSWAYGVYVWEVFHKAAVPYEGFDSRPAVRGFLNEGGRLKNSSPDFPLFLWDFVRDRCWLQNADDRPNFTEIREFLEPRIDECKSSLEDKFSIWSTLAKLKFW